MFQHYFLNSFHLLRPLFQFLKIEVLLIYSVVSFSAVQQSDSVIHICIFLCIKYEVAKVLEFQL